MTSKDTLVAVFNYLTEDESLLTLLGINSVTPNPKLWHSRIIKSKYLPNISDRFPRLNIYEGRPKPQNRFVATRTLIISVNVALESQVNTGIAFDLVERIKATMKDRAIGMNFRLESVMEDQETAYGWYRTDVLFTYDKVVK